MKATKQQKADALTRINELVKPGDTIWTQLVHVSRSGMLRTIRLYVMSDNQPVNITTQVSDLIDFSYDYNAGALKVTGCGMDVGFEAVYNLSSVLYPNGFDCIGENCPSNDHTNGEHNKHHESGGYALRQAWL